jgi:hypothetical protein
MILNAKYKKALLKRVSFVHDTIKMDQDKNLSQLIFEPFFLQNSKNFS